MNGPADPIGWAKHPRSREAIAVVKELATRDRRFAAIWAVYLTDGIVSEAGNPLQIWNGQRWADV